MSCLSDDIVRLMDHMRIDRAHVAGYDLGGAVAWNLAARRPERVKSIISVGAPHPGAFLVDACTSLRGAVNAWYFVMAQLPFIPEILFGPSKPSGRRRFCRFLARTGLSSETATKYLDILSEDALFTSAINWYRALPLASVRQAMRKTTAPAMIIWGSKDYFTTRRSVDLSAKFTTLPLSVEMIPGASHWLLDDKPKEVASLISSWIDGLRETT